MTDEPMPTVAAPEPLDPLDAFFLGKTLEGGWTVERCHEVARDTPSRCRTFLARNNAGKRAFVKVLDPRGLGTIAEQQQALDEFAYEDELVRKCGDRNLRRVVRGLASNQLVLPGPIPVPVRYLVFEWADRDMRSVPDYGPDQHAISSLKWLHHTATALQELHYSNIVHQDLKPANVLVMTDLSARVGDLGHALDGGRPRPGGEALKASTWAAPEVLYGGFDGSFDARRAVDMYQLGSLAVFMFSSVGLTTLMDRYTLPIHHWTSWSGRYSDVVVYLRDSHGKALNHWQGDVPSWLYPELRDIVAQLTDPDPSVRGHPQNRAGAGARYGFERYVSAFDTLHRKATLKRTP